MEKNQTELEIREDHVGQLMRGERPEGMNFQEFKIKRKAIQSFLKDRSRMFYETNGVPYEKE